MKKQISVGFTSLLALLFIGLKLGGFVKWSWVWVLSPIWIPWAIILLVLGIIFLVGIVVAMLED